MATTDDGVHAVNPIASWPVGGGRMGAGVRDHDWQSTSLGASDAWQQSLRSSVEMLLSTGFPMMLMTGVDLIRIYNNAYADLIDAGTGGLGTSGRIPTPDFPETDPSILDHVLDGETVTLGNSRHPLIHRGRGADIWLNATFSPAHDDAGEIVGVVMIAFDVTGYMLANRHLFGELQHRVRNNLSVVRSIARRTAEYSETLEEFADHLDGRLGAFARTQGALVSYGASGLDLHSMVADELAAAATQEGDQFTLSGPDVSIGLKTAGTLGLAFHELATNAIKFGALAVKGGSIAVSWSIEENGDDRRLVIRWEEHRAGPFLATPVHRGFGTELLERTLEYELEAETSLDYRESGLVCTIDLPGATSIAAEPDPS